ncbi:unnamed protein product [Mytilus edulis]|uniref:Mutator-like transposase domain-containing protein n=1 Tax=Mytilus edulis TaxID=6550 RepID=A0A8S3R6P1_MYTED|nr:unnamed protein product [Mytilus edulis]
MAKKKKQLSRFGLPSGRYSSTRKSVSLFSGRQKSEFECHLNVQEDFKIKLIRKLRSIKRNKAKRINLWHKCSKKNYYIYRSKEGKFQKHKITNITASGYRLINLKSMQEHFTEITTHTIFCEAARTIACNGGSAINLESQLSSYGLACILSARCTGCQKQFVLETSPKLKTEGSNHYDINVRATWGSLTSGNGLAQLNELMSTLDSPSMTQKTFSTIENEINHWWENMLEEDLKCAIEEEKRIAIENNRFHEGVPSISVICDGGGLKDHISIPTMH